jgi:hypothetical protein
MIQSSNFLFVILSETPFVLSREGPERLAMSARLREQPELSANIALQPLPYYTFAAFSIGAVSS